MNRNLMKGVGRWHQLGGGGLALRWILPKSRFIQGGHLLFLFCHCAREESISWGGNKACEQSSLMVLRPCTYNLRHRAWFFDEAKLAQYSGLKHDCRLEAANPMIVSFTRTYLQSFVIPRMWIYNKNTFEGWNLLSAAWTVRDRAIQFLDIPYRIWWNVLETNAGVRSTYVIPGVGRRT